MSHRCHTRKAASDADSENYTIRGTRAWLMSHRQGVRGTRASEPISRWIQRRNVGAHKSQETASGTGWHEVCHAYAGPHNHVRMR